RGIRTIETATRFTFDVNAIPVLKQWTHLPVIADPSHGTGKWEFVAAIARAAVAAGADGLIIEVHPRPDEAMSDGVQSLKPEKFARLVQEIKGIAAAIGMTVAETAVSA
ncbi:MAG: 3-deoxy-7-phosphoheptulonate synthase, partial [Anaerolineales bacterium]|nr:3-deoxy-7-phosphoheptulonate synthase [Anaerolineales bacterium]